MKRIILIPMLLIFMIANAQDGDNFNPKKCHLKANYDKFEEVTWFRSEKFGVSRPNLIYSQNPVKFEVIKSVEEKTKTSGTFLAITSNVKGCSTRESGIVIILKNKEIIKLKQGSGDINCGTNYLVIPISQEIINTLINNEISDVRIDYDEIREDFVFSPKGQKTLIEKLRCMNYIEETRIKN